MRVENKVRVRRDRPSALAWALALLLTMLCVWLLTLGPAAAPEANIASVGDAPRITEEVSFAPAAAWLVSLGRYDTAAEARIEAARYTPRGAAGYVLETEDGFLALGAAYDDQAEAESVARALSQSEGLACEVHKESADGARLRVTATQEDIALLTEAEALLRSLAGETRELALKLDRGEVDAGAARTLLNLSASRLEDALTRLRNVPGAQDSPVTARLLALTEQFRASLFVLSGENTENTLSLSAKIKYNNIDITLEHMRYLRELNAL